MKFSFECPIAYLEAFDDVNDYHFILAHMLTQSTQYYNFFKKSTKYKILDNGAKELGASIDADTLINYALDLSVDVLIAPDYWLNSAKTIQLWNKFILKYPNLPFQIMVVPQGNTPTTYINTLHYFSNLNNVDIIGLAYLTIAKCFKNLKQCKQRDDDVTTARLYVVNNILHTNKKLHLLGLGFDGGVEIAQQCKKSNITTLDTSTPFALAMNNKQINKLGQFNRKVVNLNFDYKYNKNILKLALTNAHTLKKLASHNSSVSI